MRQLMPLALFLPLLHSVQSVTDDDDDDDDDDDFFAVFDSTAGGNNGNCGSLATSSPELRDGTTDPPHPRQKSTR